MFVTFVPPNFFLFGQSFALVTGGGYQGIFGPLFQPQGLAANTPA
jgi:hypothetical protein